MVIRFAFGSLLFGLIVTKYKQKKMLAIAYKIFIFSLISIVLVTMGDSSYPLLITLAFLPFVIGQIVPSAILYPLCLNFMPNAKARVSAVMQGGRLIFAALSLQLAGYFYSGSFQNIGIIIISFIFFTIITLLFILKNNELMGFSKAQVTNRN